MVSSNTVGKRIRELREKYGKSQEDVGKAIDKTHATISYIESGRINLTIDDLAKIAGFFDVPLGELIGEDINIPVPATIYNRDDKNMSLEEEKLANEFGKEFVKKARELYKK